MREPIGFISPINPPKHVKIFSEAKVGDLIDYSLAYSPEEVKKKAEKFGLKLQYQTPNTEAYRRYGSNIMKVIEKNKNNSCVIKPVTFDPKMLMT